MQLVIISGRSGSGKSTALHQLEDDGYYCIDNLPVALLPSLVEETRREQFGHFRGTAVCIDARCTWEDLGTFRQVLDSLPASVETKILYLDANDATLIKRFSETRRRHPLSSNQIPLAEALEKERELLEPLANAASLALDTSQMTIYELRDDIKQRLVRSDAETMSILIQSFGFKRGVPADADLVFDVRMLANPHWVKELRLKNGLNSHVADYLESQPLTEDLYLDIRRYLDTWLPQYEDSNRSYLTVSLGCTGGQHRSVYLANRLYQHYRQQHSQVQVRHRELQ
ncbi:MAG: RNase adapter RapZ [Halioglobus sp.]